jgi:prolipoprotein diacylglyceryltransferase
VSRSPFAIQFPRQSPAWNTHVALGLLSSSSPTSLPVEPLQVYFGLLSFAVAVWLLRRQERKAYDGQLFLLFLAVHEFGKGVLELLRQPELRETTWHLPMIALALLAWTVLLIRGVAPVAAGPLVASSSASL